MLIVSLKEFCVTGRFGPVCLGMDYKEAVALLGQPTDWGVFSKKYGCAVYGHYEFHFEKQSGQIIMIHNDYLQLCYDEMGIPSAREHENGFAFSNDKLQLDTWFLQPGRDFSLDEVLDILVSEGISHTLTFNEWQGHLIQLKSGVKMGFDQWRIKDAAFHHIAKKEDRDVVLCAMNTSL